MKYRYTSVINAVFLSRFMGGWYVFKIQEPVNVLTLRVRLQSSLVNKRFSNFPDPM